MGHCLDKQKRQDVLGASSVLVHSSMMQWGLMTSAGGGDGTKGHTGHRGSTLEAPVQNDEADLQTNQLAPRLHPTSQL